MSRPFAAALAGLLFLAARPALAKQTVPFTITDGPIEVQASIDGQPAVPMALDLGAGISALASDMASRVYVAPGDYFTGFRLNGQRLDVPTGTVGSIALGEFVINGPLVALWSGLNSAPVRGLIAATAFRTITATFDYANDQLTVDDQQSFADLKRNATRVPLMLQDDRGLSLAIFARFDFGDGQSGLCEIDTGSQGFFLNQRFAAKLGIAGKAGAATIPSLALDGAPSTAIASPKVKFGNYIYDCSIGNDFWTGKSFTLDIPESALYVPSTH